MDGVKSKERYKSLDSSKSEKRPKSCENAKSKKISKFRKRSKHEKRFCFVKMSNAIVMPKFRTRSRFKRQLSLQEDELQVGQGKLTRAVRK